jgi:polyhydroxyalkanoate synthesis regulator phasin
MKDFMINLNELLAIADNYEQVSDILNLAVRAGQINAEDSEKLAKDYLDGNL